MIYYQVYCIPYWFISEVSKINYEAGASNQINIEPVSMIEFEYIC